MTAPIRTADSPTLLIRILCSPLDDSFAARLAGLLRRSGVTVVSDLTRADATIVVLSEAGLRETSWARADLLQGRLVPLRNGNIGSAAVPHNLDRLNYLDFHGEDDEASLGLLLAALFVDPARRHLARALEREATAWAESGWRAELLIEDHGRASQARAFLAQVVADPSAVVSPQLAEFVRRSIEAARRRRRRQVTRWSAAGVLALVAASAIAVAVPAIEINRLNNVASFVTAGDRASLERMPEWSAINASALLLTGTPVQKQQARQTIVDALALPWAAGYVEGIREVASAIPLADGRRAATIYLDGEHMGVALQDFRVGAIEWRMPLPGGDVAYRFSALTADERFLLVSGNDGAAVVDLTARSVRRVPIEEPLWLALPMGATSAAVVLPDVTLGRLDLQTGNLTRVAQYPSLYDMWADEDRFTALVAVGDGRVGLFDSAVGEVVATVEASAYPTGTIGPGGSTAVVSGPDGQFWQFGEAEPARPTGIAVPAHPHGGAVWTDDGRLVVVSEDRLGEVYLLSRGLLLGVVCNQVAQLNVVTYSPGSDIADCSGSVDTAWDLPDAPRPAESVTITPGLTDSAGGRTVRVEDGRIRIDDYYIRPAVRGAVTAVAMAPDGSRAAVGTDAGDVAVLSISDELIRTVTRWHAPDSSAIVAVGWTPELTATTRVGDAWAVPECGPCRNDQELIDAVKSRLNGCFTPRQLTFINAAARKVLGFPTCAERIGG